jgi:hypothetical protein
MQEQEDDGDGEKAALDHRLLDVAHRILDAARAVAHDVEPDIDGKRFLKLGDGGAHALRDVDGVGALGLDHVDGEGTNSRQHRDVVPLLLAVDHVGDLAQVDGRGAAPGDDQVGEVSGLRQPGR